MSRGRLRLSRRKVSKFVVQIAVLHVARMFYLFEKNRLTAF